ncbi:GMC family oxidoreductase [Sphingomonas sp.]|uniref:GMC family oxidoreductase n=1 Tax=Sphingomonas sp. TaxID=28214 RepID=UPI002E32F026|nr:GMC family oxidoreductase N-terminal domain-containing protein [Sphingomonas sp.]HEX4695123.1 GMC family oxidoreductase N-terminal domain-containing protein [Sphingomonas sp.]
MEQADIVVIGGGSGGAAAAGRLSEDGRYSVALLEAGGRNTGLRTRIPGFMGKQTPKTNWAYETVPQKGLNGRRGYQPRGRGLGGSSAINAMLYIRGAAWDYDNWAALGCDGWSYADVLPVFKRCEANERGADDYHGGDGPLIVSDQHWAHAGSVEFVEAGASLQLPRNADFNGPRQEGLGLYQVTQKNGERWTAGRAYIEPALSRSNFRIVTDAVVERVLFEDGKVWGVAYNRGGQSQVIRATKVVLAGGVFGTAQLLMLSGVGPAAHLAEHGVKPLVDRAAVGANLQDHVDYVAAFEVPGRYFLGQSFVGNMTMLKELVRWLRKREGVMTSPFAEAGGFLTLLPGSPAPDVQFHFVPVVLEDHGRTAVKAHGFSCHVCVLRPESHGTVRLASADVRTAPLIDPAFLTDDRDMAVMKAGVRAMYRILQSPPLNRHGAKDRYPIDLQDDEALDRLIRARADTVYHPVGTARMGSDAAAVCDPKLRVRGVEGLYVADASVMPKLVSGNTNAPSIMIGERCADFVRADLH